MKENPKHIHISEYNYPLPDERIAKFPLPVRDQSKLLVYRHGEVTEDIFTSLPEYLPKGSLMIFNNTKVIQARLHFRKETGALIEVFCLEPIQPNDYVLNFQQTEHAAWLCMIGNLKKWKDGTLKREMTVSEAIRHIRDVGEKRELIYTCYVVDDQRKLEGVVTLKELLLSPDSRTVGELMEAGVISALTTDDREEAARRLQRYDFLALPVTDREGRLVGIVTVDDVMDVMEAEATEDFERMAAMAPSEKPYLKTGAFTLARKRILWLLVLMISGMITGGILGRYEAAFAALPMLVTFIPMLTDTGGNAGSQSSTLIIRGMAVGEIRARDLPRVLWKELRVSLIVGVALSAVNYARLLLTYPGQAGMALTVALSMLATVVMAKTIGGMLPILAKALHADPAIMAAPLITTIVDALSLLIYFSLAQMLLGI